jgi:hypothetical protein
MNTLTQAEQDKIRDFLKDRHIAKGLGIPQDACSIAAINLALTGKLSDTIPDCMSPVVGRWIIVIQDAMPDDMRNSREWRELLPLAAGTGRLHEKERLDIILDWMWGTALPLVQPVADAHGFGVEWSRMCSERSAKAAADAAAAADEAAAWAARAAQAAARRAAWAGAAGAAGAAWAAGAAKAAGAAAWAAGAAWAAWANAGAPWAKLNPPALLARLVAVSEQPV